jgi:PilZ domain-containing protein
MGHPKMAGQDVMLHPGSDRRGKARTLLILPVSIAFGRAEHAAVIRDISASGLFLFSSFTPAIGEEIELKLTLPAPASPSACVTYYGKVVRLTSGVAGAAVGIGLTLNGTRPAAALQSLKTALVLREAAGKRIPNC